MVIGFSTITNKIVSSNPAHGEVYFIQHYVIKFVSDLQQVDSYLPVLWFPPTNKIFMRQDYDHSFTSIKIENQFIYRSIHIIITMLCSI
jgi:hypothetical protein